MNRKKVSVIVAAYNAHDTLARCLGSLVNQTLEDIEIVVVNDASTDDTWEIMQRCEAQFPDKVVIINGTENRGPGGAKNQGLDAATGEYIGFCDSDDYADSSMFEKLYRRAVEKDADIAECGFFIEASNASTITTTDDIEGELDTEKRKKLLRRGGYLWNKIYKRELFNDPPIRMRPCVSTLSDNEILKYMYLKAGNIWTVKEVLYFYSDTPGAATKVTDLEKYYKSIYGVMEATYDVLSPLDNYKDVVETIEYLQMVWYSYGINRCIYEQIQRYGAKVENVPLYFEGLKEDAKNKLQNLAQLRKEVITGSYKDNEEAVSNISEIDMKIMEECDRIF